MPLSREAALDILGLPSFASREYIILRYKFLALEWFPQKHNSNNSLEVFRNITRATIKLLEPSSNIKGNLDLENMYHFFHHIFFGSNDADDCECDQSECSGSTISDFQKTYEEVIEERSIQAEDKATQLIMEEEEEKMRLERRKARKKRRKEKKKLEKEDSQTQVEVEVPKEPKQKEVKVKESKDVKVKKPKKPEVLKPSDSDEDLDPSSAFVSVVAEKHKKQIPGLQIKKEEIVTPSNYYTIEETEEDPETIILKAREIALMGNAKANEGRYLEAVQLFSESIQLDPSDHRFYGNRSYCYDRLSMYEKALKDADKSIKLCTKWPKGYFRKGRALLGLRNYALAEKFFTDVLRLDNDCEDAISELRKARLLQIMEKGYTKEIAEAALSKYGSVSEALTFLLASDISRMQVRTDVDIFISDDEIECVDKPPPSPSVEKQPSSVLPAKPCPLPLTAQSPFYDIKLDPRNPEGHNSIWIGNVQPEVTEKKICNMFGKFGDLISVRVMPEKSCAFVNYKSKSSPGKAMETYQGYELNGKKLLIRFPNLPGDITVPVVKKPPGVIGQELKKGPINGNECYFWRTNGCIYGDVCRYKHIKENRGIDKKSWQVI